MPAPADNRFQDRCRRGYRAHAGQSPTHTPAFPHLLSQQLHQDTRREHPGLINTDSVEILDGRTAGVHSLLRLLDNCAAVLPDDPPDGPHSANKPT